MKRNFFRYLISAVLMMCCTVGVWAGPGTQPDNEIWYTSSNGKVIEPYDKTVFGATYQSNTYENGKGVIKFDKAVTKVGDYAFYKSYITGISLPNTVKSIGKGAFYWSDLAEISFGNSVESIGDDGDSYGVFAYCDKLTHIDIPNTVTSIGKRAFYDCDALEAIGIPASVTSLGESAFYDCNKLKFAAIGCGVTNIPQYAFYNCNELKSVAIDGNRVTLGYEAFYSCEKLESVSFFGDTPPSSIGDYCFSDCSSDLKFHVLEGYYSRYNGKSTLNGKVVAGPPYNEIWYTTNNGGTAGYVHVAEVADCAPKLNACMGNHCVQFFDGNPPEFNSDINCFMSCTNLVSVVMPSSITSIGKYAFNDCTSLVSVSIPDSVDNIGQYAFFGCSSLQTLTIPKKVNNIGNCAFKECYALHSVTILGTINNVGDKAFDGCWNLYNIFYFGDGTPEVVTEEAHYSFKDCPAIIYVKDVTGHDNWGNNLVCSWRSGKGDGTKESPLEIGNYQQLYGFSLEVAYMNGANLCAKLTNDITGSSNVLNEDGTPKGIFNPWLPIGGDSNEYKGEFDGQGHTISGLYINDKDKNKIGLFGRVVQGANIHNLGVKDSYFSGNNWVAGICGDFNGGSIENCWNGATVISNSMDKDNCCAGGIAASCWTNASVKGCYNIGKVTAQYDTQCGGICGVVNSTVSDCVTLDVCNAVCKDSRNNAKIINVAIKDINAFKSGEVCHLLNGNKIDTKWRQQIGKDAYPVWTGSYLVNHSEGKGYYNETLCEKNVVHNLTKVEVQKCNENIFVYWHCTHCGKDFTDADRTKEETDVNKSGHFPIYVLGIVPTGTSTGLYGHWHCSICGENFTDESCKFEATEEELTIPVALNNEIWYTTTDNQQIAHGVSYQTNEYQYGLGKIVLADGVTEIADNAFKGKTTLMSMYIPSSVKKIGKYSFSGCTFLQSVLLSSGLEVIDDNAFDACTGLTSITIPETVTRIGKSVFAVSESENKSLQTVTIPENSQLEIIDDNAFNRCRALQSIRIPSSVKKIGNSSFWGCTALESVFFASLPNVIQDAFENCGKLTTKVLDLTDGDKPYIGTSLENYPEGGFTEARYNRTLEKNKLETIVLPFVPTAASIEGLDFYTLTSVTDGKMTFIKVGDIHAGEPYLIKNTSDTEEFTFIAADPKSITIKSADRCAGNFTMRAAFQKATLKNEEDRKFYYLNGETFKSITGSQEVDPFRAYIETPGTSAPESFAIKIHDGGTGMEGDGTLENPYRIRNKADLDWFVDKVNTKTPNACAVLMADIKYNGEAKLLDDDGNIKSGPFDTWRPIGNSVNCYSGDFNGNGHTISGLYVNDENKEKIGLFGRVVSGAHIHNLGIEDSYFNGRNWVAGICGDFNGGSIENCWNGATAIANSTDPANCCAGGIAASCWTDASVKGCYNVGKVSAASDMQCGGICGIVNSTVEDCVTLDVCDAGCNDIRKNANVSNVFVKGAGAFSSGEVCWLLNGGSSENVKWHQTLGESGDKYPTLTGEGIVYLTARKCDGSGKAFSNTKPESVTQDEHEMISHEPSASTCVTHGMIQYRSCKNCGHLFKYDSDEELTEEQVLLALDPDNHNLTLSDGKAHCEWCKQDWEHYLAQDGKPVLLNAGNDSYSLDKVDLKYGHSYLCTDDVSVNKFSYTFPYYPNVWNSLFVPFEITTGELGENGLGFTAAYIAGVRQYEKDASGNIITQVDVVKIKNGRLFAGTPYLIKKESAGAEPLKDTFEKTGATLKKSSDVDSTHTETATAKYDFIGTYNEIAKENVGSDYYIIGSEGTFVHPSSPIYAMNWYMQIEEKGSAYGQMTSLAKTIIINVIGEEDQTTGIRTIYPVEKQVKEVYDLSGRRLYAPKEGQVNIINGKKVLVE